MLNVEMVSRGQPNKRVVKPKRVVPVEVGSTLNITSGFKNLNVSRAETILSHYYHDRAEEARRPAELL